VKPEGTSFDTLGGGEGEGKPNVAPVTDDAASRGLEVLRQISSTGYLRKRVPLDLMVLQGGMAAGGGMADGATSWAGGLAAVSTTTIASGTAIASGTVSMDPRAKAKMQGYEGDPCGECGNYTLVRNGTCLKCNTCGGTSGCS
jgi:ribonucleoside-diphosphate reductase alpha chain